MHLCPSFPEPTWKEALTTLGLILMMSEERAWPETRCQEKTRSCVYVEENQNKTTTYIL